MKKIMTLVLVIVMLATLCLTGCQPAVKPTDPTKGSDPATKPTTEATEPKLEEKTVQIWLAGVGMQTDTQKVWKAFNELLQKYVPNTTVEFTIFPFGEYAEKFTQMIAGEEPVDLAWSGWVVDKPSNIRDENIVPLEDLLNTYGKDIIEVLGQSVVDAHKYFDGHTYAIPSWQGLYGDRQAIYLVTEIVNLVEEADYAKKLQDAAIKFDNEPTGENCRAFLTLFEKYFEAADKAGKLGAGVDFRGLDGWGWINGISYQAAVQGIAMLRNDPEWKVVNDGDTDASKVYYEVMASWYEKGYIRKDYLSAEGLHKMSGGVIDNNTYISYGDPYINEDSVASSEATWGCDLTVILRSDHGYVMQGYDTGFSVPYSADEPERAMMVLNAIYKYEDLYNLLIYGIEGEHYTKNADGTITTPYEGAACTAADAYSLQRWVIGSCKNAWINNGSDPDYYPNLEKLEKDPSTHVTPWLTFQADFSKWSDWEPGLVAAAEKYGRDKIITAGSNGWKALQEAWVAEQEAAGLDKYLAAQQAQVDAWREANNITSWNVAGK